MMKTIIETDKSNLVRLHFEKDGVITEWGDLSLKEQMKVLNTFSKYYNLYLKFLKPE